MKKSNDKIELNKITLKEWRKVSLNNLYLFLIILLPLSFSIWKNKGFFILHFYKDQNLALFLSGVLLTVVLMINNILGFIVLFKERINNIIEESENLKSEIDLLKEKIEHLEQDK